VSSFLFNGIIFYGEKMKQKPIIVYWAPEAILQREHQQILLEMPLLPVIKDIQKRRNKKIVSAGINREDPHGNGYQMCTALHELSKNLYYIKAPFDVDVSFTEDGSMIYGDHYGWFKERVSSIDNALSADFDFSYMLFSEEKLDVSITPPYLHQTSQPEYGFICAVKWDISSWFRPHILIYQLWKNKKRIHFKKDEALAYLKFETSRPIVFKEYKITEEILSILDSCLKHKFIVPFQQMESLYRRFTQTSIKKRLIAEIKKNVIE
jgi:hypothetical protein